MARALLLDQSSTICGYAAIDCNTDHRGPYGSHGKLLGHGTVDLRSCKDIVGRVSIFREDLQALFGYFKPHELVVEDTRYIQQPRAENNHNQGAILFACQEVAQQAGVPLWYLNPGTVKKQATGNGRADKAQMVSAAKALWPGELVGDDNHADALCMAFTWLLEGERIRSASKKPVKKGKRSA